MKHGLTEVTNKQQTINFQTKSLDLYLIFRILTFSDFAFKNPKKGVL
jgi:hypothetical protein